MRHRLVVIDFDKPNARVYTGSYNFSSPADIKNGENLWMFQDRRIAVAYTIEALAIFDHYKWRDSVAKAQEKDIQIYLAGPPATGQKAWWAEDYMVPLKVRDRILFSQ